MAKKLDITSPFAKTGQPLDLTDLEGNIKSTGVGLTEGEIKALDAIGAQLGEVIGTEPIARNALIRIAAKRLILSLRSGELTLAELAQLFDKPDKPRAKLRF